MLVDDALEHEGATDEVYSDDVRDRMTEIRDGLGHGHKVLQLSPRDCVANIGAKIAQATMFTTPLRCCDCRLPRCDHSATMPRPCH